MELILYTFCGENILCNKSISFCFRGLKMLTHRRSSCLGARAKYTLRGLHLLDAHIEIQWSLEYQFCSFFVFPLLPPYINFLRGTGVISYSFFCTESIPVISPYKVKTIYRECRVWEDVWNRYWTSPASLELYILQSQLEGISTWLGMCISKTINCTLGKLPSPDSSKMLYLVMHKIISGLI